MPRSRSATCAARFSPGLSRSTPSLPCPAPGSWPPRRTAGSGLNFLYMDILMEAGREWNWPEIRGQRMNRPASSSSPAARNASRTATPSALSSTSTNRWTGRSWLRPWRQISVCTTGRTGGPCGWAARHRCCRWIPCSMPKARATARWPPFPTASCGSTAVPPPLPRTAGKKKHS